MALWLQYASVPELQSLVGFPLFEPVQTFEHTAQVELAIAPVRPADPLESLIEIALMPAQKKYLPIEHAEVLSQMLIQAKRSDGWFVERRNGHRHGSLVVSCSCK